MADFDLVIRGGLVVDGAGGAPFEGDIAVDGGKIAAVGAVSGSGREEIDARHRIVTPGFLDIHTHYDGQVTWGQRILPSSAHGVTTAVMGNCGIGFAPCRAHDRDRLVRLMEGVEDLPGVVLTTGLPWDWESFPDYLDFVGARRFDLDVAAQLPHAALRVFAMGERAEAREKATAEDCAVMAKLAGQAIAAGALGFATSRTINHRASDGTHVPTLEAGEAELTEIALALKAAGRGVLQVISDFDDIETDLAMLRRVAERSGRPMSVSLMQWHHVPDRWRQILAWIEQCNADGIKIKGQVAGRPIGLLMGFEFSVNPFCTTPTFQALLKEPIERRRALLRQPDIRARILAEAPQGDNGMPMARNFAGMYALGDPPNYEPTPGTDLQSLAEQRGVTAAELAYDAMLEHGGQGNLICPSVNFAGASLEAASEMLRHPDTVYGLGDGGAHLGFLCDASLPTYMLQHWARDRTRGPRIALESVVRGLTSDLAAAVGLHDRGTIRPGLKADINVIDFDRLTLHSPTMSYDLPAGGRRLDQQASGYTATIVSGQIVRRDDQPTGALPGRLVRGSAMAG